MGGGNIRGGSDVALTSRRSSALQASSMFIGANSQDIDKDSDRKTLVESCSRHCPYTC